MQPELDKIMEQLKVYEDEEKETLAAEALINAQIAALMHDRSKLREKRSDTKKKLKNAELDKESIERKIQLELEAEELRKSVEDRRLQAHYLIATAPWFHDAFDWQIDGAVSLPNRALVGDKRGMGKTLTSLIWRRLVQSKKTLVCLRKEVAEDFIKEIHFREPGVFVYPLLGVTQQDRAIANMLLSEHENFIVVTNIESWRRNIDATTEELLKMGYDAVILDEAHHIKNSKTGTAQGFFRIAEKVPNVLELTGTPIKNKPQEMFSLLHALYPDLFPDEKKFLWDHCVIVGQNKWEFSEGGLKLLFKKIDSFFIARSPEDVGRKVPPPRVIEYKLDFEAHQQQKEAYQIMTERNLAVLNSGKVVPIISQLAVLTRQAQVVSWPAGINFDIKDFESGEIIETVQFDVHQSVKMDWAQELIQELVTEKERVIFFSRFKPAIYELKRRLIEEGVRVAVITGDETGSRLEIFNDFDLKTADPENYKYDVLLATYQTVGESANLNAARHCVLYDRFWNPGNEDQAIGRIDRINSIDQATVHVPIVEDSIDIWMTELIESKRNMVAGFKDAASMQSSLIKHLEKTL